MGWGGFMLSVYYRRIFEWFFCPVDSLRLVVFADVGNIGLFCGLCHLGVYLVVSDIYPIFAPESYKAINKHLTVIKKIMTWKSLIFRKRKRI